MTLPKKKQREALFLCLFSIDSGTDSEEKLVSLLMEELKMTMKSLYETLTVAKQIFSECEELDEKISKASTSYEFERIPRVERNILRLALYEMKSVPGPIVISEAIRLTRKFSTAESGSFINAILDNLLKHGNV